MNNLFTDLKIGKTMSTSLPELLSAKEAAEYLRQKPDFVRDLVRRGELDGYAIGGPVKRRIVVPRKSLLAYLEACKVKKPVEVEISRPKTKTVTGSLVRHYAGRSGNKG